MQKICDFGIIAGSESRKCRLNKLDKSLGAHFEAAFVIKKMHFAHYSTCSSHSTARMKKPDPLRVFDRKSKTSINSFATMKSFQALVDCNAA